MMVNLKIILLTWKYFFQSDVYLWTMIFVAALMQFNAIKECFLVMNLQKIHQNDYIMRQLI